jgi:hypothetical protein
MGVKLEKPPEFFGADCPAVALFSGIGLLLMLIAVSNGVQGIWL